MPSTCWFQSLSRDYSSSGLADIWWCALRDYAFQSLSRDYSSSGPATQGRPVLHYRLVSIPLQGLFFFGETSALERLERLVHVSIPLQGLFFFGGCHQLDSRSHDHYRFNPSPGIILLRGNLMVVVAATTPYSFNPSPGIILLRGQLTQSSWFGGCWSVSIPLQGLFFFGGEVIEFTLTHPLSVSIPLQGLFFFGGELVQHHPTA